MYWPGPYPADLPQHIAHRRPPLPRAPRMHSPRIVSMTPVMDAVHSFCSTQAADVVLRDYAMVEDPNAATHPGQPLPVALVFRENGLRPSSIGERFMHPRQYDECVPCVASIAPTPRFHGRGCAEISAVALACRAVVESVEEMLSFELMEKPVSMVSQLVAARMVSHRAGDRQLDTQCGAV